MTSNRVRAALVAVALSSLAAQSATPTTRHPGRAHSGTAGVPLITFGQDFDQNVQAASDLTGRVGFVWGDNKPFGTAFLVNLGEYGVAYRSTSQTTDWFYANHPDWIVYLNDRHTVAYQFGDTRSTPLDIRNPAVAAWKIGEVETGFSGQGWVDLDNLNVENGGKFAGHYAGAIAPCAVGARPACGGSWRQDFTGGPNDPAWILADRLFVGALTVYFDLHGRQVMINNAESSSPTFLHPSDQIALALAANGSFSEGYPMLGCGSFKGWVNGRPDDTQFDAEYQEFVAESGRPFFALGYLCNHTLAQITPDEEAWATAVFLLGIQKTQVNYLAVCGSGAGLTDCAGIEPYPASMNPPVGPITDSPPQVGSRPYVRHFAHGLAAVNPSSSTPETVTVPAGVDQFGNPIAAGPLVLQPMTAIVVVTP